MIATGQKIKMKSKGVLISAKIYTYKYINKQTLWLNINA